MLLSHFDWRKEDPKRLGEQLSRSMLPSDGNGDSES
jgi:hypothetical protein